MERRIRRTINKYDLLRKDDKIAVGVSGGKDSLTLLTIFNDIEKRFPDSEMKAILIDEGIKHYREQALEFALKLTKKLEVPLEIFSFKDLYGYSMDEIVEIAAKKSDNGPAPCSYCGTLRRRALNYGAKKMGANKLATAHNLDDEAETVLMNILRSDINRIGRTGPMTKKLEDIFVTRIKPMREIPEKEIVLYAYYNNIPFHAFDCPYAPRSFRSDIRDILTNMEEKRPGIKFALLRSGDKIQNLITKSEPIYNCIECGQPSTTKLCKICRMFDEIGINLKKLE